MSEQQDSLALADKTTSGIDRNEFRQTLGRFASGITIITANNGDDKRGMTASAFVSVSLEPPLILISVTNSTAMNDFLQKDEVTHFGVNILSASQQDLSDHFAGKSINEDKIPWLYHDSVPLIKDAISQLVCSKHQIIPAGDHTLYIGLIKHSNYTDEAPLVYFRGKYQKLA